MPNIASVLLRGRVVCGTAPTSHKLAPHGPLVRAKEIDLELARDCSPVVGKSEATRSGITHVRSAARLGRVAALRHPDMWAS
jgi:hypothetical protein